MLWQVKYKSAMGLVLRTVTEATQDAALECALRLYEQGYSVIAVGNDVWPRPRAEAPDLVHSQSSRP